MRETHAATISASGQPGRSGTVRWYIVKGLRKRVREAQRLILTGAVRASHSWATGNMNGIVIWQKYS